MTSQTTDQDFLARLDAAIGCMECGKSLAGGVSDLWCSESCSTRYASERAPASRDYDYFAEVDEDESGWEPEDLADLEPVGWITPPVWRLPRSTGDLEADQAALNRACELARTPEQQAACDVRQDALDVRQRAIWAREWRLPRSTGNYWADRTAVSQAERTATTDAQRAACALRREDLDARRGKTTRWGIDEFVFPSISRAFAAGVMTHEEAREAAGLTCHFDRAANPIVTTEQAQRAADAILARTRSTVRTFDVQHSTDHGESWTDLDATSLGSSARNNLPGLIRATVELRRPRPPRMLVYELYRDCDNTLLMTEAVPYREGITWCWRPPHWVDLNGTHMRVILDGRTRQQPATTITSADFGTVAVRELGEAEFGEYRSLVESRGNGVQYAVHDEVPAFMAGETGERA